VLCLSFFFRLTTTGEPGKKKLVSPSSLRQSSKLNSQKARASSVLHILLRKLRPGIAQEHSVFQFKLQLHVEAINFDTCVLLIRHACRLHLPWRVLAGVKRFCKSLSSMHALPCKTKSNRGPAPFFKLGTTNHFEPFVFHSSILRTCLL
jgi:hypothetical protein